VNKTAMVRVEVRRVIAATPARLFEAWTTPAQLLAWWGPRGVRCTHAEVDARLGGRFRIANERPDGRVVWISGEFLAVEPPNRLVYTWTLEPGTSEVEHVTVHFVARTLDTEVVVVHERIDTEQVAREHRQGWHGCLERLADYLAIGDRATPA
jgi:uncharacterized protein YndB with AHSA1/START domain